MGQVDDWVIRYGAGPGEGRPALFLDRDGTLIENVPFISDPDRVVPIPGVVELLSASRRAGYAVVVVTNQSGIARGLCSRDQYLAVEQRVQHLLGPGLVDAVYACPFHPDGLPPFGIAHDWRKPERGMLVAAQRDLGVDLATSIMVGDSVSDIEAGLAAGVASVAHVLTGHGRAERDELLARWPQMARPEGRTELLLLDSLSDLRLAPVPS